MTTVHANDEAARPMFIMKGTRLRYRALSTGELIDEGANPSGQQFETIGDCLPMGSIVTCRKDIAGVDKDNFEICVFVSDMSELTANGRKSC